MLTYVKILVISVRINIAGLVSTHFNMTSTPYHTKNNIFFLLVIMEKD